MRSQKSSLYAQQIGNNVEPNVDRKNFSVESYLELKKIKAYPFPPQTKSVWNPETTYTVGKIKVNEWGQATQSFSMQPPKGAPIVSVSIPVLPYLSYDESLSFIEEKSSAPNKANFFATIDETFPVVPTGKVILDLIPNRGAQSSTSFLTMKHRRQLGLQAAVYQKVTGTKMGALVAIPIDNSTWPDGCTSGAEYLLRGIFNYPKPDLSVALPAATPWISKCWTPVFTKIGDEYYWFRPDIRGNIAEDTFKMQYSSIRTLNIAKEFHRSRDLVRDAERYFVHAQQSYKMLHNYAHLTTDPVLLAQRQQQIRNALNHSLIRELEVNLARKAEAKRLIQYHSAIKLYFFHYTENVETNFRSMKLVPPQRLLKLNCDPSKDNSHLFLNLQDYKNLR